MLPDRRDQGPSPGRRASNKRFSSNTSRLPTHKVKMKTKPKTTFKERQASGSRSSWKVPGPRLGSMTGLSGNSQDALGFPTPETIFYGKLNSSTKRRHRTKAERLAPERLQQVRCSPVLSSDTKGEQRPGEGGKVRLNRGGPGEGQDRTTDRLANSRSLHYGGSRPQR